MIVSFLAFLNVYVAEQLEKNMSSGGEKGSTTAKTPADFLKSIRGRPVVVKLNSGVDYRGLSFSLYNLCSRCITSSATIFYSYAFICWFYLSLIQHGSNGGFFFYLKYSYRSSYFPTRWVFFLHIFNEGSRSGN